MTCDKKRRNKLTPRKTTIWLPALLTIMIVAPNATETGHSSVEKAVANHGFQQVIKRDEPVNCEDLLAMLDIAIIDWRELPGTHFIMIASRGTGEQAPNLIRGRFDYAEDYLKRKQVQYLFAEGSPIKGAGRIEIYVGGRLTTSIPVKKNATRLCRGTTGA